MKYSVFAVDTQISVMTGIYVFKSSNGEFEGIVDGGNMKTSISCANTNCEGCKVEDNKTCSECGGAVKDPPPTPGCVVAEGASADSWWRDVLLGSIGY